MTQIIELEITPINGEILVTMPAIESVDLVMLPVLTPPPQPLPTDPLAYYILAKG